MPATVIADIVRETDSALLLRQGHYEVWIPRSQCDHISKEPVSETGERKATIQMRTWLAKEKALEIE